MAGRIFLTLGIFFGATEFVLSDGYFGYPTRDIGQRQVRRCPTCPADSPESLSSPWYGSPQVYGQDISLEPSNRPFDRRPSASIPLHRDFHRGSQNFEPATPKHFYVHPTSGASNSHEHSRRPSTNRNVPLTPHHRFEDTSSKFDSLESHDFPHDLVTSSSRLPERYRELGNTFGKPHQAPTRRVSRHYGNARENPNSEEELEKSANRLGAIETPSKKMVWVVYRADAGPESDPIENANFVTVPTRAEGKKVATVVHPEEPMSDSQLEEVVLRAIAAATRKHRHEDSLYGRSRGTLRAIQSNEHRRGDEETAYDSGCEFQSAWKKIQENRLRNTEFRQTGSHPETKRRTHFGPPERKIDAGWSGNREAVAGRSHGEENAGSILREEPEVSGWEDEEEEEEEMDNFGREEKKNIQKPRTYFGVSDRNVNSGTTANGKVTSGRHYGEENAEAAYYEEEAEEPEVPEGTEREEQSWTEETRWLGKPEVRRLPATKPRTHLALPGRNMNIGSSGNQRVITGSHYDNEDAGIAYYQEEPEVPEVSEVPEETDREEHSWSEETSVARLPVTKPRTYFAPSDRNIHSVASGNRKMITGSHFGNKGAGIVCYKEEPEVPEAPKATGHEEHSWSEEATQLRQPEVPRLPVTKPRTYFAPPDRNINPGSSGNRKIITGSRYGNGDAGIIFYEEEPEVPGPEKHLGRPEVEEDEEEKIDEFGLEENDEMEKPRTHFAPPERNINPGSTGSQKMMAGSHYGSGDAGVIFYEEEPEVTGREEIGRPGQPEVTRLPVTKQRTYFPPLVTKQRTHFASPDRNIKHGSSGNRKITTGSHRGEEGAGTFFYEDKNINPGSTGNWKMITGNIYYEEEPKVTDRKEHARHPVTKPRTHLEPQDKNVNSDSTGNRKIVSGDEAAEIVCHKKEPEVTDRKDHSVSEKHGKDEVKNGHDSAKSAPISSDRLRKVEDDGGFEEPEVRPKLKNYRTQSRSDEEVATIRKEDEGSDEKVAKIEESTKAPCLGEKDGGDWMLGEMIPDFFEDMENPPTVTEPPLRLNFGCLEASTPSPST